MAFAGRRLLVARAPDPFGPGAVASVVSALGFWVVVSYAWWKLPDWMLCYFASAEQVPLAPAHALFALTLVLAALSGHTLAAVLLQRGRTAQAVLLVVVALGLYGALWGLSLDRYLAIGTTAEYLAGTATPLPESSVLGAFNAMGVGCAVAILGPMAMLFRAGRRLRPT